MKSARTTFGLRMPRTSPRTISAHGQPRLTRVHRMAFVCAPSPRPRPREPISREKLPPTPCQSRRRRRTATSAALPGAAGDRAARGRLRGARAQAAGDRRVDGDAPARDLGQRVLHQEPPPARLRQPRQGAAHHGEGGGRQLARRLRRGGHPPRSPRRDREIAEVAGRPPSRQPARRASASSSRTTARASSRRRSRRSSRSSSTGRSFTASSSRAVSRASASAPRASTAS